MVMVAPSVVRRLDYRPPDHRVDSISLRFRIEEKTTVTAELFVRRLPGGQAGAPLVLNGRGLELLELKLDADPLPAERYRVEPDRLLIPDVPEEFRLWVVTRIAPESNTTLEGMYRSGPMLCTQCEAHGFSRITYYPDRPDVLAKFRVRIEADREKFPVLLANGNCLELGALAGGRHYAVWEDPFPKPAYLFALVAGDLALVEDGYTTNSGRRVALRFYVDRGNEGKVAHAMESLKRAMRWDEDAYGLEYDLDTYMVVAARDANMGAMENKGLNLFSAAYVLASPETATDQDYENIEAVIGHEYFHNWTGNRVTCRDWFQLSLKEGLTVFREQQFSAAMGSPAARRLAGVRTLRARQFPEDAGPMAHPVRPDSYVEINNFYTATVYEKGAELIRMIETVVGAQTFVAGVREYLRRHDGQAATIEDFLAAHEAVSGRSLEGFRRWYSQAGTPVLEIADEYDEITKIYTLKFRQVTTARRQVVPLPIRVALLDGQGKAVPLVPQPPLLPRPELVLLESESAELRLEGLSERPTPAFLHGFSAPVKLAFDYAPLQLVRLAVHGGDAYVRWEAVQRLMLSAFDEMAEARQGGALTLLLDVLQRLAYHAQEDRALLAELLRLPSASEFAEQMTPISPLRAVAVRDRLRLEITRALMGPLSVWAEWAPEEPGAQAAARRRLGNLALWLLAATGSERVLERCRRRVWSTRNMTLVSGALAALNDQDSPQRDAALGHFYKEWRSDALVFDKWFALEASSAAPGILGRLNRVLAHPDFDPRNPTRVRAVLSVFARDNVAGFHAADGSGYALLADWIARLDPGNPQLAARLCDPLLGFRRYAEPQQSLMRAALTRLADLRLSADLREKVDKALAGAV